MILTTGVILGFVGASLTLTSFLMKNMLSLRVVALLANAFFIAYGLLESNMVALTLHSLLVPVNAKRVWDIRRLIHDIEAARADTPVAEWLLPHMRHRSARAGDVLWQAGEEASEMLYLQQGTVRLIEHGSEFGPGALLGEIGLFSPDRLRTQGLVCVTDCELYALTAEGMYTLYYQNPKLGFHLMRLVVGRLLHDVALARNAPGQLLPPPLPPGGPPGPMSV